MTGYISRWDRQGLRKEPQPRPVIPIMYQNGANAGVNYGPSWVAWTPGSSVTVPLYNGNYLLAPPPAGYYASRGVLYTPVTTTTQVPASPWVCHTTYPAPPPWAYGRWGW